MDTDNTQGVSQPVAYEIHWKRQDGKYLADPYLVFANEQPAEHWKPSPRCVPLYRQPQPTLTDAEREAIRWFSGYGDLQAEARRAEALKGLLERLG